MFKAYFSVFNHLPKEDIPIFDALVDPYYSPSAIDETKSTERLMALPGFCAIYSLGTIRFRNFYSKRYSDV